MSEPQPETPETPDTSETRPTSSGPGRVLVAVYGVFALSATGRSVVQLSTKFHEAPLAYLLSAFAAVVYLVATLSLARTGVTSRRVARIAITTELVGVLTVGTISVLAPSAFPSTTVSQCDNFGIIVYETNIHKSA